MATYYEIPLTSDPDQTMMVTIPVDDKNVTVKLRIRYNTQGNYWWMAIYDQSGTLLVDGIPLICGNYPAGDLLEQYQYLGLGSCALAKISGTAGEIPDSTNLGTDFVLIWGSPAT